MPRILLYAIFLLYLPAISLNDANVTGFNCCYFIPSCRSPVTLEPSPIHTFRQYAEVCRSPYDKRAIIEMTAEVRHAVILLHQCYYRFTFITGLCHHHFDGRHAAT